MRLSLEILIPVLAGTLLAWMVLSPGGGDGGAPPEPHPAVLR